MAETETKKKATPKKATKPAKQWLCANCVHLSVGTEHKDYWCDAWCAHVSPSVVSGCVHRNAGEPFEE